MRRIRFGNIGLFTLILSSFIIGFTEVGGGSYVQSHDNTIQLENLFQFTELANDIDNEENLTNINYILPSSDWNITGVNLNFTDIRLGRETLLVEENGSSFKQINKFVGGYGVQLNITEETILFGVEIYGYIEGNPFSDVFVEIRAYEGGTPNSTIFGDPVLINMTNIPGWHIQSFPDPIHLDPGYYFLILNGSDYDNNPSDNSDYLWYLNEDDSIHTSLITVKYDSGWSSLGTGKPFRHKLIRRVNRSYNPEEINMTAEINGEYYNIINGSSLYSGNLSLNNLNFSPNDTLVEIPIHTNQSFDIIFNLSYDFALKNLFISDGEAKIQEGLDNTWSIFPSISRIFSNQTLRFKIPSDWTNVIVLKNENTLSQPNEVIIIGNYLYIWNISISSGAIWEIKAQSAQTSFSMNFPESKFEPNQELKFSVSSPAIKGHLIFILIDALGFEAYYEEKEVISSETIFSYTIPSNPHEGKGKIYVYWSGEFKAGIQSQEIEIIIPFTIDPQIIYLSIIIISLTIAIGGSALFKFKKIRTKREFQRQKVINKCVDVLNLNYVMVIEKESGLAVYEEYFGGKSMETTLITGFLEAIRKFGIELTGAYDQSQTIKLEYQDSKILMSEFKNFRLITIMKDNPSEDFLQSITSLSYDINKNYRKLLQTFNGHLEPFKGIKDLVKEHLNTVFLSPLKVVLKENADLNSMEKTQLRKAQTFMKQNSMNFFFSSFLLPEQACEPDSIEAIFNLINKNIFQPYEKKEMKVKK